MYWLMILCISSVVTMAVSRRNARTPPSSSNSPLSWRWTAAQTKFVEAHRAVRYQRKTEINKSYVIHKPYKNLPISVLKLCVERIEGKERAMKIKKTCRHNAGQMNDETDIQGKSGKYRSQDRDYDWHFITNLIVSNLGEGFIKAAFLFE